MNKKITKWVVLFILSGLILGGCKDDDETNEDTTVPTTNITGPHIWIEYNKSGIVPSSRVTAAMAYAGGSKVIMFGGLNKDDTWEYDVSSHSWTEYNTSGTKPEGRRFLAMAYAGETKVIMFGGSVDDQKYFNDTWEYDVSTHIWTEYNTSGTKPSTRAGHRMAYIGNNKIILFGGNNYLAGGTLGDTWEYDASTHIWTEYNTSGTEPSARFDSAMAYVGNNKVIMFGGHNNSKFGDTWKYDISTHTWTQLTSLTKNPDARYYHAMVYSGDTTCILYGGGDLGSGQTTLGDIWEFDSSSDTWSEINTNVTAGTNKPGQNGEHTMAYAGDDKVLLFGGTHSIGSDTWVYEKEKN